MTPPSPEHAATEEEWIWETFRYHSRTFSLATYLLPSSVQMSVATLYLFCRRVDSIADHRVLDVGPEQALREAQEIRTRLEHTLNGDPPTNTILWPRIARINERHNLPTEPLYELIRGAEWDLNGRTIESKQDLISYSNLVGGSVGAMMLPFLTAADAHEELEPAARRLGIAMQITNIVRDVGEDVRRLNRVYLPTTWRNRHGIPKEALADGRLEEGYPELLEEAMETAEILYSEGLAKVNALPLRARIGIRSAARMYREIMNEVRANGYDNLTRRAYVTLGRKLALIAYDGYESRKTRLRAANDGHV